jgi:hypothetical protein
LRILTGLIAPTPGNKYHKAGSAGLIDLLQHLKGPVQLYTSLASQDEDPERQKIIQPLIKDLKQQTTEFEETDTPRVDPKYWIGAFEKLNSPNDHFHQSLGAESFVRIATEEIWARREVLPIFNPRAGLQGRDFYFKFMGPQGAANVFGGSLGRLAEILRKK